MSETRQAARPEATVSRATAALPRDRAARLSLVWVFLLFNYLYCDVLGLYDRNVLKDLIDGTSSVDMTPGALLAFSVLMEIPIAMVLLSVVLPRRASRWANVAAGAVMAVVQIGSLVVGSGPTAYYLFFSVVEIATTVFVVWFAWTWPQTETQDPLAQAHD